MGNFYANITVTGPSQSEIIAYIKDNRGLFKKFPKAYVSLTAYRHTVIFDEKTDETQDVNLLKSLSQGLSKKLQCPVFAALNHDDDVLYYMLFVNGELRDQYISCPESLGLPESEDAAGNPEFLCSTYNKEEKIKEIEEILNAPCGEDSAFEVERLRELLKYLGLPEFAAGFGFRYLSDGDVPDGLKEGDLILV